VLTSRHSARAALLAVAGTAALAPAAQAMPPEHEAFTAPVAQPAPVAPSPDGGLDWTAAGGAAVLTVGVGASARIVLRRRASHAAATR
jgi:hypothetical protein